MEINGGLEGHPPTDGSHAFSESVKIVLPFVQRLDQHLLDDQKHVKNP